MLTFFYCFLGACLGSFIPCYAERRQKNLSQKGRSYCMNCGTSISPLYLVPIFGYFLSKGRCVHCNEPIPKTLVLFELSGALTGYLLSIHAASLLHPALQLCAIALLLLLSLDDWHTQWIHDQDLLLYAGILLIDLLYFNMFPLFERLIGAALIALPLTILFLLRPNALGSGDILFMGISGFYLGPIGVSYAFLIGILCALIYGLYLILRKGESSKTAIPLIPFLSTGVIIIILLQPYIFFF